MKASPIRARRTRAAALCAALVALGALPAAGQAQPYPTRPIRMISPFPPGGPTDIVGRLVSQRLAELVGQPILVDSRPGASGNVGLELAARSPADGYTIVLSSPVIALSPLLYTKLNYDPQKDLTPIALVGAVRNVLVVHPSVPARTLKDLVQLARKSPGRLNYGSGGIGTTTHLAPELLKSLEKLDIVHVPYKGSGIALGALAGGEIDMLVVAAPAAVQQIISGRVRALAVLMPQRLPDLPEVPTSKESGFPNFEISVWYGMLAPTGTPREIVNRLNAELAKAVTAPDMKTRFAAAGVEPLTSSPEEFGAFIRSEAARFAKVIRDAGIKAD
ncbi:MAG: tripartite tricarboxylate transporter substrate binding protein [Proteobacteria bacterium]|nr:tripartite tricarboxylate transporter substrate binding protein [Burkholderiales bacterium]